jgi:hypothetical protein
MDPVAPVLKMFLGVYVASPIMMMTSASAKFGGATDRKQRGRV